MSKITTSFFKALKIIGEYHSVHYTKSSSNGHVLGSCETENCLSWMM